MRVARVLLPSYTGFDSKCFEIDRKSGAGHSEASWMLGSSGDSDPRTSSEREVGRELRAFAPSVLHVYGNGPVPHSLIVAGGAPWLADRPLTASRPLLGRRPRERVSALLDEIPEPVADEYFAAPPPDVSYLRPTVGTFARGPRTASICELTHARIHRFRDDVDWRLFDAPPSPDSMAALSLWVDPALDDEDLDGLVCEAIAIGLPVVASRTATNRRRSDDGRAAALCPKNDPNELAHAIVSLLFKDERSASLRAAACEIREKFRPARRREALLETYARVAR